MSLLYKQCAQFCENLMVEGKQHPIKSIQQNLKVFFKQTSRCMFQVKKNPEVNKLNRKKMKYGYFWNKNNYSKSKVNSFGILYIFKTPKLIQYTQHLFLKYF